MQFLNGRHEMLGEHCIQIYIRFLCDKIYTTKLTILTITSVQFSGIRCMQMYFAYFCLSLFQNGSDMADMHIVGASQ